MIINKTYGGNSSLRRPILGWIGGVVVLIALSATIATAVPFQKGDVFAAVGNSEVKHYNSSGTLLEILNTGAGNDAGDSSTTGMAFDKNGNLYVTGYRAQKVSVFNNSGVLQGTFGSGYNLNPESIVLDAMGNIYVGQSDGTKEILKFDMAGNLLANFTPLTESRGTDWIDLAADQKTMFYTSEGGSIMRFDASNNTQLPNFVDGLAAPCFALRIRPNGEVMVACSSQAYRLNATGGIMQTYPAPSGEYWFALNLDPDGTSFWTGDYSSVGKAHKIDIANGTTLMTITTSSDSPIHVLGGLAVFGELTVATPPTVYITANPATHDINVSTNFTFTANPVGSWGNNISYSWSIAYDKCSTATSELTGKSISEYLDVACGNATISVTAEDEKNNTAHDTYLLTVHEANAPTVYITAIPDTHDTTIGTSFTFAANPVGSWGNNIQYNWSIVNEKLNYKCPSDWNSSGQSISASAGCTGTHTISVTASDEKGNVANSSYSLTVHGKSGENGKIPIIFVPGIMGSELTVKETFDPNINDCALISKKYTYNAGDRVWMNIDMWNFIQYRNCGTYLDVMQSDVLGQPLYPQIGLNGKIVGVAYDKTIEYFEDKDNKYSLGINLFIFPYDWRNNITDTANQLDSLVETVKNKTSSQQVNVIAHSMGGLVSREYIRVPERAKKVKTLVELAVPNAGSPLALDLIITDYCFINKGLINLPFASASLCVLNPHEQNKLAQNWIGGFELLPSKKYYQLYSSPDEYPFSRTNLLNYESMNYDQSKAHLADLKKNMYVFEIAEKFHDVLDPSYVNNNGNTNDVNVYLIAGSGFSTIGQIQESNLGILTVYKVNNFINGDGTVPLKSATLGQQNNVYYVKKDHGGVAQDADSLQCALKLVEGDTDCSKIDGVTKKPFDFTGSIAIVFSPVNLHAYDDQNNHVGKTSNETVETNISGSSYDELGESKFIYLPDGGHYRITTNATGEGSFDLKIRRYKESMLQRELSYLNVNQTNQTTASMSLDSDTPILFVDLNGDGITDQQLPPTNITDYKNTIQPSSGSGGTSGGGGGGGGGGTSGENYSNIEVKEKYDLYIYKGKMTSYAFTDSRNPIVFINITGNVSAGEITTAIEVLKDTSSLVTDHAPGTVYRNVNVWIGTSSFAVPKNINKAVIRFRVENSWISGNSIESSSIKMARWDKDTKKWDMLDTSEIMKDSKYTYFDAQTNALSPLAITVLKAASLTAMPSVTNQSGIAPTATVTPANTGTPSGASTTPSEGTSLMNWSIFIVVFAMVGIIIAVHLKRKGNIKK